MNTGDNISEYSRLLCPVNFLMSRTSNMDTKIRKDKLQIVLMKACFRNPSRYIRMKPITQKYALKALPTKRGEKITHQDLFKIPSNFRVVKNRKTVKQIV